ncbi:PP2C family protein-serine/threonine phosphatase [Nocardioides sp. Bht2]|uniref:PP2C family protein-serine/threonine phosphatase n=1 Tax=Nocardioides sp. Bht2 TaxID=3392297 RepID=UPI0039B5FD4B
MTAPDSSAAPLQLAFSAISDVGRVRKDNQDSGYAGPWLLAVCDGVGGAARGDIASSTAIQQLRRIDAAPGDDLLGSVAGALHRAHDRIGELVDEDPNISGTSTTATLALFDGARLGIGHIGDSRAYLLRDGVMSQLTRDHTFVQSLIDEGRITEAEARVHPHRNLILKAVDGVHETEPDLFLVELALGDRILLCSDGASGVLDDDQLAAILGDGTVDYAAVELVRASLEAGSTDNVTCVVAEVSEPPVAEQPPMLVGAAADLPRRSFGQRAGRLLGHRATETDEYDEIPAEAPAHAIPSDPIDPEIARYAPRAPQRFTWLKILGVLVILASLAWAGAAALYVLSQRQYYVSVDNDKVTIFRGVDYSIPLLDLSTPVETFDLTLDEICAYQANDIREGIKADSLSAARRTVTELQAASECISDDDSVDPTGPTGQG